MKVHNLARKLISELSVWVSLSICLAIEFILITLERYHLAMTNSKTSQYETKQKKKGKKNCEETCQLYNITGLMSFSQSSTC